VINLHLWLLVQAAQRFMNDENAKRQENEILLLQAAYPAEFSWRRHRSDQVFLHLKLS
jgi:hypothetical protein